MCDMGVQHLSGERALSVNVAPSLVAATH
jgi:hypothetical protein